MKILITGANGFIGSALRERLAQADLHEVISVVRKQSAGMPAPPGTVEIADLVMDSLPSGTMEGVDAVLHTAARVHVMSDRARDPLAVCRQANVEATLKLARQAAWEGVRRFVYISTAKVHGEVSRPGEPFVEVATAKPRGAYAVSKYEAECRLMELGLRQGMEVVVIRPPLVYGPNVRANFQAMMRWVYRGLPLPLGAVNNKRSLLGLDNLADLIAVCLAHPKAANEIFLAADGEDISTPDLLRRLAEEMNRPARLVSVPLRVLVGGAKVLGKGSLTDRLCGNFQVNIDKARNLLEWSPPVSFQEGLARTAEDFLSLQDNK